MIKKILIGIIAFFVLVIGGLIASTFIFKDQINDIVKKQINNEINAQVDYSSYDLSIIRSFPDFKFALNDLIVLGVNNFEGDTLATIKNLDFNLDAKRLFQKKELMVHSVSLDELNLKTYILADSSSSLNILKEKVDEDAKIDTASESLIDIEIESIIVKNANILYFDALTNQEIILKNVNIDAKVDYIEEKADINTKLNIADVYYANMETKQIAAIENLALNAVADYINNIVKVQTDTKIASTSFIIDGTKYLNNALISLDGTAHADLNESKYDFNQKLGINNLKLDLSGFVQTLEEDINMDLKFASNQSTFKEFLSLVPEKYLKDFENIDIKGGFAMNGLAKGTFNENSFPAFDVNLAVDNGFFKYPDLPTALENINFNANVKSTSSTMSNLALNVPKANLTLAGEPIDFRINMTNLLEDPFADLSLKGKINLAKLTELIKLEDVKKISGNLNANVAFKGKLSDVEKKQFEAVDFQGDIKVRDVNYEAKTIEMPVNVKTLDLDFTPKYANLSNMNMTYGKSDIKASGKVENLINYVLSDGTVSGNLNINSNRIDLTEIMGEEEETTSDSESTGGKVSVPENINFTANANIKELKYDEIILSNIKGALLLKDEALNVKSVSANMLGGSAVINGLYSTKKVGKPVIDFKYDIKSFDIKETFNLVNTVQAIAPIAKYLDGNFSSAFSFNSVLGEDFMPDLSMLTGLGNVNISYASFMNFPLFKSVSEATKIPLFQNLNQAAIKNAWTVFKIEDGKVNVEPFDYQYQDIKMNLFGSNGFDKTIDYTMKLTVPSDKFGGAASIANNWLSKQNIPLLNLSVPKEITFHLNLSGLINKPKVSILKVTADKSDKGIVEQITTNIADKAKAEAEKLRKEAERKAREEAEKLKKELERKAKQEADRIAKEAAERAKKEAEKTIKDALKDKLPNFGF